MSGGTSLHLTCALKLSSRSENLRRSRSNLHRSVLTAIPKIWLYSSTSFFDNDIRSQADEDCKGVSILIDFGSASERLQIGPVGLSKMRDTVAQFQFNWRELKWWEAPQVKTRAFRDEG